LDRKEVLKHVDLGGDSSGHDQQKDLRYLSIDYFVIERVKLSKGPSPASVLTTFVTLALAQSMKDL